MDAPRRYDCQLVAQGGAAPLRVLALRSREALSACFTVDVDVALLGADAHELSDALIGARAAVSFGHADGSAQSLHGVLVRVEPHTAEGGGVDRQWLRARLAPRLARLGRGAHYRIFQGKSALEIVRDVLEGEQIPHRFETSRTYEPQEYVVQYEESDLRFVERVLAREGMLYAFDHEDEGTGEVVVISDRASPLGDVTPLELPWRADGGLEASSEGIHQFRSARRVRERASAIGAFDFRRPLHPPRGEARVADDESSHGLRRRHVGTRSPVRADDALAETRLEQDRARARTAEGESRYLGLAPGKRFELVGGPIAADDGVHHIVRVERTFSRRGEVTYTSTFTCVPDGVVPRMPAPKRRLVQVVETAIVVGPPGQEIHVDELGRIKVRFHWDASESPDDRASCWIRTSQAWAGAGWGFQFIPRVGMEVLVTFLGGDVDAPVVIGCVNNLVNPPAYPLPASRTKSGIRSRSSRGGDGYNEIAFEDRKNFELLSMHAQRNLDVTVLADAVHRIGGSLTERVGGAHFSVVEGNAIDSVGGNNVEIVTGDATRTVGGNASITTEGARTERVAAASDTTVEGDRTDRVIGRARSFVDGAADAAFKSDASLRVEGSLAVIVGKHDAPRAYQLHVEGASGTFSTGPTEITSDEGITLRCGDSVLTIGPDAIQIRSKKVLLAAGGAWLALGDDKAKLHADAKIVATADEKIFLKGESATVSLAGAVKIDGSAIKLKSADSESIETEEPEDEVTTISLVDAEGRPLAGHRYRIVLDDGTERVGALDAEGRAEVRIPSGGQVFFPGVTDVEEG